MKATIFAAIATAFLLMGATPEPPALPVSQPTNDFCELYGSVFIEEVAGFADYRVHVEDVEAFADMVVFREDAQAFAADAGHWYVTDVKAFADFTIYIEEVKGFADFSIFYTDFRTTAGCR